MADTIESNGVTLSQNWGSVSFNDYLLNGVRVDFQDLMVAIAEKRAVTVEGEVQPMSVRMRTRNADLDLLGNCLSELTAAQATLDGEAKGKDPCSYSFSPSVKSRVNLLTDRDSLTLVDNATKKDLEYFIQLVKSEIDSLNNASQTDMSRLQSLVDRRDESYSTATNMMTAISDTRGNLIRNL
jgi:hypothetical protein